ncbi:MAG: GNAT family N-acetyltransferase [Tabrizicola sp.]
MRPHRCEGDCDWSALLRLIQAEFAYMDGRIDPPSSMLHLTEASIAAQAQGGEVWAIGTPPVACLFLTEKPGALYLGKLAVASAHRGKGFARQLVDLAVERARDRQLPVVELQTRVELLENQAAFQAMGFVEVGRTAHAGYDRPTSITYRRTVF